MDPATQGFADEADFARCRRTLHRDASAVSASDPTSLKRTDRVETGWIPLRSHIQDFHSHHHTVGSSSWYLNTKT